jgi:cell wall-associated NlpC family hydrolase
MSVNIIISEAESWIGTPYHPHGRLKGVGVDCAMLIAEVFECAGVVPHVDPGFYPPQFGMHRSEEQFASWVERYGRQTKGPSPGGVVLLRYGRCFSHGGIVVKDNMFIHAVIKANMVIKSGLCEPEYAEREMCFYEVSDGR